jgi:transposase
MSELTKHYSMLLGLDHAWQVTNVQLTMEDKLVEIRLGHSGQALFCPDCGGQCPRHDYGPERTWRHLDTMQFETRIVARIPRTNCDQCGVKTIQVPWAGKHSRFTLMFEAFAIEVLNACGNVSGACSILRLDWDAANSIMARAVSRGLARRSTEGIKYVGIDEKSFGKGHNYVSVMTDVEVSRVLEVTEGRDENSADKLWESIEPSQREQIEAVTIDMWKAFINSSKKNAKKAAIVFDRFHISKHLNEAVDQVRRKESKSLKKDQDERLVGTKQLWLYNPENFSNEQKTRFSELRRESLKTGRAWALKEQFRHFWEYSYKGSAAKFFKKWHAWAVRCRIKPIADKAKMLQRHLEGMLNYFDHRITNAKAEGFNSKIQFLKAAARGFRSFFNYRTRILFYCGKLKLMPDLNFH